jgi:hypothetical protein
VWGRSSLTPLALIVAALGGALNSTALAAEHPDSDDPKQWRCQVFKQFMERPAWYALAGHPRPRLFFRRMPRHLIAFSAQGRFHSC